LGFFDLHINILHISRLHKSLCNKPQYLLTIGVSKTENWRNKVETFWATLPQATIFQMMIVGIVVLLVWFLPAILSLFFNPKHTKLIAIACVPAGLSLIAWSGIMIWALTGKVFDKFQDKIPAEKSKPI
jgi:hypothetical protein